MALRDLLGLKPAPLTATEYERQEMRAKDMDLGEAMARSAGWKEKTTMTPVSVNKYKTPTANNYDCQWSVGVMNLTEAEADLVGQFARNLRSSRPSDKTEYELRVSSRLVNARGERCGFECETPHQCYTQNFCERRWRAGNPDYPRRVATRVALTDDPADIREDIIREGARAPEPEEERNRFSGLDLE